MSTAHLSDATSRLGYLPALDGVRGISVLAVLLFHGGVSWAVGGYLGVSTFFTLSGYLITSLLLAEHAGTGRIDLGAFWRRRFRRLLPASLACIVLVLVFGLVAASAEQRADLGGDVVASLAYVANWWFLASGESYADLFVAPSPLLHFWSLAIEEQFYLLFPLLVWGIALVRRRPAEQPGGTSLALRLGVGLGLLTAATAALPFLFDLSDDWLYYATPARAPELLLGALAAVVLHARRRRARLERGRPATTVVASGVGLAALALMGWLWATTPQTSAWLYEGGLPAYAVISTALIVALHVPGAVATRLLAVRPLRHLGRISYGVYLYHWPLYLWLDQQRTGLEGWPLLGLRVAVSLVLAELSYRFLELPVRRTGRVLLSRRPRPGIPLARWGPAAVAVLAAGALVLAATAPTPELDLDRTEDELASVERELTAAPPPTNPLVDRDPPPDDPEEQPADEGPTSDELRAAETAEIAAELPEEPGEVRVAAFGDSTAMMLMMGVYHWSTQQPGATMVPGVARMGCGLARSGEQRLPDGQIRIIRADCLRWPEVWAEKLKALTPDVALVLIGPWDVVERRGPGDEDFLHPSDPAYFEMVQEEMLQAVDLFTSQGTYVVWLTGPPLNANAPPDSRFGTANDENREQIARLNELVAELPDHRPGKVEVIDLAGWLEASGEDLRLRPDGVHFSEQGATEAMVELIGPGILERFHHAWSEGAAREVAAQAYIDDRDLPPLRDAAPPGEDTRVLVWGDEDARDLAVAVAEWAERNGAPLDVAAVAVPGCGIARPGMRRLDGEERSIDPACRTRRALRHGLAVHRPHLVVLAPGLWSLPDQTLPGERLVWVRPVQSVWNDWKLRELGLALDGLRETGAATVSLTTPVPPMGTIGEEEHDKRTAINDQIAYAAQAPVRAPWSRLIDVQQHAAEAGIGPTGEGPGFWAGHDADQIAELIGPFLLDH